MTRRNRRRRRRRRRAHARRARRRRHHGHHGQGNAMSFTLPDQLFGSDIGDKRTERALFIGSVSLIAVGLACVSSYAGGSMFLFAIVCIACGVVMCLCLVAIQFKKEKNVSGAVLTDVTVHQPSSPYLQEPLIQHPPNVPVPSPSSTAPLPVAGLSSPTIVQQGYPAMSGQIPSYYPGYGPQPSGGLPPATGQPSSLSYAPSFIGGQASTNPSTAGGEPPPYFTTAVIERPWEKPPSYLEASSGLFPQPSAPEVSTALRADNESNCPQPSAPHISIGVTEDHSS